MTVKSVSVLLSKDEEYVKELSVLTLLSEHWKSSDAKTNIQEIKIISY